MPGLTNGPPVRRAKSYGSAVQSDHQGRRPGKAGVVEAQESASSSSTCQFNGFRYRSTIQNSTAISQAETLLQEQAFHTTFAFRSRPSPRSGV